MSYGKAKNGGIEMRVFTVENINGNYLRMEREIPEKDTLHSMYRLIDCRMVDYMSFEYKGISYDVWFDDEFLVKGKFDLTLILGELKPNAFTALCGNLMFAKSDEEGRTIGLTEEDIDNLWEFTEINTVKQLMAFHTGLLS